MAGGGGRHNLRTRRLSGHSRQKIEEIRADVNITPLVDVVLVLLIIFMVVIPLMARGREVPLPRTSHHSERPDALQPVLAVDAYGDVWFDTEKVGPCCEDKAIIERLGTLVQRAWDTAKNKDGVGKVYLKIAGEIPYGKVYPLIIAVNQDMNVDSIDLATAELKEE
jgi:biopolymer transport protein ExbD